MIYRPLPSDTIAARMLGTVGALCAVSVRVVQKTGSGGLHQQLVFVTRRPGEGDAELLERAKAKYLRYFDRRERMLRLKAEREGRRVRRRGR